MNPSRRTFLVTGTLGMAALAAGGWLQVRRAQPREGRALGPAGVDMIAALVPVLLAGALPVDPQERQAAIAETLDAVDTAIAGLPPGAQGELTQLFGLMALAPARMAVGAPWRSWRDASPDAVEAMLGRWQSSRVALLRSAYDALHQLVLAAWYGNPRAWAGTGYPGPPSLA